MDFYDSKYGFHHIYQTNVFLVEVVHLVIYNMSSDN